MKMMIERMFRKTIPINIKSKMTPAAAAKIISISCDLVTLYIASLRFIASDKFLPLKNELI
jgi:hypothetical protein